MNNQFYLFLIYIVSGVGISIFFDIFRVLRKSIKTSNFITYIEDAIFWIIVGLFLIWEIFTISYGELRSYIFIGLLIGVILYLTTISKYFIKINVKILNFFKSIILKIINILKGIYKFILKIINPIYNLIKKPINFIIINLSKIYKNVNTNFSKRQSRFKTKVDKKNDKKRRILHFFVEK